ncbi:hypothetical protein BCV72DRAFT_66164 [Rhizopus microsporus var. microsporus]|uniref:Nucleoplasmin-like domain-containing protein n=2 Tax=Rhizopus microsporus TaxID=58291 RepID=A0A2G4T964_RHIZD|nr:uncharacterized protein RHIMIDRAFT_232976 [Rhizopus microsporus ATCC 52813]ORE01757.1 hypothetical protein BCV72DRAFT_66164 [Rhizopus microsporus var. microsporus]PHZ17550.1 hypothetical protein RHIMIDRAFT_232976 [Rhizopus microsporus ATCC 52813]
MKIQGIYGITVRPRSRITIKSGGSFQLTMASLRSFKSLERTSLYVETKKQKILLCSLIPCTRDQQLLNFTRLEGETVTFVIKGKNTVQLSGNYISLEDEPEPEPKRKKAKVDTKNNIEKNKKEKVGEKENIKVAEKRRDRDQQTESKRRGHAIDEKQVKTPESKRHDKATQDDRTVENKNQLKIKRHNQAVQDEAKQVKNKANEKVLQDEHIVDDIVSILKARGEPSEEDEDETITDVNSDTDDEYAE